ncbi:MAG: hypothetical protein C0454_16995, partial [Parvibaculum sp.]|nr:hypothetical protein [Parvibaculum sp.]
MSKEQRRQFPSFEDEGWNDDIAEDLSPGDFRDLVVFSRDWTVETVVSQIRKGNIDVEPDFQRRNAWNDGKRSLLIESLILGIPVPEIVLATAPDNPKSFIVIDGKQRLLAILGFIDPDFAASWDKPRLQGLQVRVDLNGKTYEAISKDDLDDGRLLNADVRCAVISNYAADDVLYHIFYRLNTGSVPLSTQELRQSLNKGPFSKLLAQTTDHVRPIHEVLRLSSPDKRLRDAEILLRFIAFHIYGDRYRGN